MKVECQSCHGTYDTISADGVPYFHVCPPLSSAEIRGLLEDGLLILRGDVQTRLEAAQAADAKLADDDPAKGHTERLLATLTIERLNKRNENIVTPATKDADAVIVADGAGVLEVVDAVQAEPAGTVVSAPQGANGVTPQPAT